MEDASGIKNIFWFGTAIIFISVLSVVLIVIIYQNQMLKIKNQQSKTKLDAALQSEKQERSRIASDLHDGVSGDLNAVRNYIAILAKSLKDSQAIYLLSEMEEAVENAAENIQNISNNLMPPLLESHGLIATLKTYFARIKKSQNIFIDEIHEKDFIKVPTEDAYEIYRIIQELISNSLKHGKANHLTIKTRIDADSLLITIKDNGKEFNVPENLKRSEGMGLKNISTRILKLNASLEHTFLDHHNITKIDYHVENCDC